MKVLFISSYATCNTIPLLSQCKAGFGYMVYDIGHSLTAQAEVHMLLSNYRYSEFFHGDIKFVESTMKVFFKNSLKCSSLSIPVKLWWRYKMQPRTIIRLIYYWLISGHYFNVINEGHYDIVHIHGCGFDDDLWIDVCRRAHCPFVLTLHGLNSFSDSVNLEPAGKRYERDFLERVVDGEFPITVISSGIKKKILNVYNKTDCNNIEVVCNSFAFIGESRRGINLRELYSIPQEASIILYVGNVSRNKNQEQLIRAFEIMPKDVCDVTYVLFCGRNIEEGYTLEEAITDSSYSNHLIQCGNVDKEMMPIYYQQSNGVVLLSISEGFGLSLVEGMHFGKPCMTFKDLDAFDDIYDDRAVIGISNRSDATVAEGLQQLLSRPWDGDEIKQYSKNFESSSMAKRYLGVYNKLIS